MTNTTYHTYSTAHTYQLHGKRTKPYPDKNPTRTKPHPDKTPPGHNPIPFRARVLGSGLVLVVWGFVRVGFCPGGVLSGWGVVRVGFCPGSSPAIVPMFH